MANQSITTTNTKESPVPSTTYRDFVESHQETLNYLLKFGSPMEQAKAGLLMDLAEGVL